MTEKSRRKETTIDAQLYKYYESEDGRHPVRIRVTHNRKVKYYPVQLDGKNLYLNLEEWGKTMSDKPGRDFRNYKEQIQMQEVRATEAMKKTVHGNKPFTFERFEKEFLHQESEKGFLALFYDHLQTLKKENRIGTYRSYLNAYNAFKAFRKQTELSPFDLTTAMLKAFETSLQGKGCGKTTIGMYARALKVIFNLAAEVNPALLEHYPFARKQTDRNRYKIRTGSGHKGDALTIPQLQKFIATKTDPYLPEHEAKLLWLFSFYCQGMNMKDVSVLRYKDIQGSSIVYVRAKTKDTEAQEAAMEIPLSDPIREIIRQIGNPDKRQTSYVFSIIPNGLASTVKRRKEVDKTPEERIDEIIRQKIKMINSRLKQICKDSKEPDLKDLNLTTYWARHTFASLLKESGESVEMIRELLGHSDIRTTESYLKRFDMQKKQAVSDKIQSILKVS